MINLSEIKTVFLCAGIVFASVALCESAAELEKEGDRYNKTWGGGDYNIAQDRYWRAAALGAEDVIHKLDDLYKKGWRWYDLRKKWDSKPPENYIQQAADKFYPASSAKEVETKFIIVAPEADIIKEAANSNFEKSYDYVNRGIYERKFRHRKGYSRNRTAVAVDSVRKDILIAGKNGKVLARSRKFDNVGIVALLNEDTARQNFNFLKDHQPKGVPGIYVRSPIDENSLIPIGVFHKYIAEAKRIAFVNMCFHLGAYKVKMFFDKEFAEKIGISVACTESNVRSGSRVAEGKKTRDMLAVEYLFTGEKREGEFSSPWLTTDNDFKELHKMLRSKDNKVKKAAFVYKYMDLYNVTAEIMTVFEKAIITAGGKYERFYAQAISVEVEFP